MELNAARFGTPGIITRIGDFLQAELDDLPVPDAVFIGGDMLRANVHGDLARYRFVQCPQQQ